MFTHQLDELVADMNPAWKPREYDDTRTWSYGDVENNGVFYHPELTHYAHQAFEGFFFRERGLQYADLSGRDARHEQTRLAHTPPIRARVTFPVDDSADGRW